MQKVVVVGGGIAGVSIARELAKAGVGVKLFERSKQLCAGATWHAAGLVTRFAGSPKLKKLHVRSLQLLTDIHEKTEGGVGLHLSGSIRLVETGDRDRALEARHHVEMAKLYDDPEFPTTLVTPSEIAALHPLVDASLFELGVRTTNDGDVDPTLLTNALAADAKGAGCEVFLESLVEHIEKKGDRFIVSLADREPEVADAVVNCCGLWSQQFSSKFHMAHPAYVIEHHYAVTEPIDTLKELRARGVRVPVLRDLAGSCYLRQEQDGILVGPYEKLPSEAVHTEWSAGPPLSWAWDLFPDNLDRLDDVVSHAMQVVPALQDVGFASVVNGPTIWAPDSLPRCGRTRVPGYYDFNTLTYGIAQSMPLAEYLSRLMIDQEQPYDLAAECDPLRFGPWANAAFTEAKVRETYSMNNSVSYAFENRKAGRDVADGANKALADVLKKHGAVTSFSQGIETATVFAKVEKEAKFDDHDWARAAVQEAQTVRNSVAVTAATGFSKIIVKGASARDFLMDVTTNVVPKTPGACRLTYAVAPLSGRVVAEFTVSNVSDGHYYLVGPRDYAGHDVEWLKTRARALQYEVDVANASDDYEILLVAGPDSKATLLEMCSEPAVLENLGFLKFTTTPLSIAGVPATVGRVSFTGEAGYELHVKADDAPGLFDSLAQIIKPFGSHALNSLRLEKGFKVKADLDYARLDEAGVDAFVRKSFKRPVFDTPPERRSVLFAVDAPPGFEWSVPSDCPVLDYERNLVGFTTTSAFGSEANKTIAAGYVRTASSESNNLYVECFGHEMPCSILEAPPAPVRGLDPQTARAAPKVVAAPPQQQQQRLGVRSLSTVPQQAAWLREEFFELSRRSFEEAHCFGGSMYADDQIHADERRHIFRKEWVIIGHKSELAKHGDVVPFDVAGQPMFAANNKGKLVAYHNVCRHRGAKLVDKKEKGRAVVTCPYHRWGYALDGRLVGTPCWDDDILADDQKIDRQLPASLRAKFDPVAAKFDRKDYGLYPVELEVWGNMLFARLGEKGQEPTGVSLDDHLGDLKQQLRNYPLDETIVVREMTLEHIDANWKVLCENFSEYYHLPAVHPELCNVSGVDEHLRTQGKGKYLGFATSPITNGGTPIDANIAPPMPGLEGTLDAVSARHIMMYPNTFMTFYPHHIFRVIVEPISANVSRERTHLLVHPKIYQDLGDSAEETIEKFWKFHTMVNTEDMGICRAVQRGMQAAPYDGGRLSFRFEETIHRFQNMVADSLVGRNHHVPEADAFFDPLNDLDQSPPAAN